MARAPAHLSMTPPLPLQPQAVAVQCPSPPASPLPAPCSALASSATTTQIAFSLRLAGVTAAAFTASATLQSTLTTLVAGVAGVSSSAVSLLGVTDLPAGSRRRLLPLLLPGERESEAMVRQLAAAAAASAVTVTVLLPASRGSNATEVQRVIAALSAYVQSGQLGAALAASASLQVRMGGEGEGVDTSAHPLPLSHRRTLRWRPRALGC